MFAIDVALDLAGGDSFDLIIECTLSARSSAIVKFVRFVAIVLFAIVGQPVCKASSNFLRVPISPLASHVRIYRWRLRDARAAKNLPRQIHAAPSG